MKILNLILIACIFQFGFTKTAAEYSEIDDLVNEVLEYPKNLYDKKQTVQIPDSFVHRVLEYSSKEKPEVKQQPGFAWCIWKICSRPLNQRRRQEYMKKIIAENKEKDKELSKPIRQFPLVGAGYGFFRL